MQSWRNLGTRLTFQSNNGRTGETGKNSIRQNCLKEMLMVRIQGVIRFTSPFHISAPGEARYDFNSNNFVYGAKQGTTCTTVRKDRIATRARLEEGQKPVTEIPNIPPDTLRGILRRKAAYRVIDAVLAKGQEVDLDT